MKRVMSHFVIGLFQKSAQQSAGFCLAMIICLLGPSHILHAQTFHQVYPAYEYHDFTALARWNGDTVFAAGLNSTFLRSTDAGLTWVPVFAGNTGYGFVRMGANSSGIYLMPTQTPATEPQFADSTSMFVYRYNPWTNDTTRLNMPCPVNHDISYNSLFADMSVTTGGVYIIQSVLKGKFSSARKMTLLYRKNDELTWRQRAFPDSINSNRPSIFFRDDRHGILICGPGKSWPYVYSTSDGGDNWYKLTNVQTPSAYNSTVGMAAQWIDDTTFVMAVDNCTLKRTTDMGASWSAMAIVPMADISSICFNADGTGIVVGKNHDICLTRNHGTSWQEIHPAQVKNSKHRFQSLMMDSITFIFAGHHNIMYRTSDAGMTWDAPNFIERSYSPVFFDTDNHGLGYCYGATDDIVIDNEFCVTSNGGASWDGAFSLNSIPGSGAWIIPVDGDRIWALQKAPRLYDTLIYLSTDGGQRWDGVCRSSELGDTLTFYDDQIDCDLSCGRDSLMILSDKGILRTMDCGKTWQLQPQINDLLHDSLSKLSSYVGLFCRGNRYQWLVVADRVLRTSDFGATWTCRYSIPNPPTGSYGPIICARAVDDNTVCMCVEDKSTRRFFMLTTDSGDTWETYENASVAPGTSETFLRSLFAGGVGYAVIYRQLMYQTEKILYKTEDYWHTTTPVFSTHEPMEYVTGYNPYFRNQMNGWITNGCAIYRTTNGGIDWVRNPVTAPRGVTLAPIHPNPVKSGTDAYITYGVSYDKPQAVNIEVYDIMGRRIWEQHRESVLPGEHTVRWETGTVPPGVYVVRLLSGRECMVKKLVVR